MKTKNLFPFCAGLQSCGNKLQGIVNLSLPDFSCQFVLQKEGV